MRRALICFVSVQGLGRMGYHHRVGEIRWPCTEATMIEVADAMEAQVGHKIALTSMTWLEPPPSCWARFRAWLRRQRVLTEASIEQDMRARREAR